MTPEELQPLLDALGDVNILENLMDFGGVEGEAIIHARRGGAKSAVEKGVHYSGAHWYAKMKDGSSKDSYSSHYQVDGTAHFCQTFAVMIYTGNDKSLTAYNYASNIEKAMDFLAAYVAYVKKDRPLKTWLVKALKEVGLTLTTFEQKITQARGSAASISTYK